MRFSDHLPAFKASGALPKIHHGIISAVQIAARGRSMLDLGACHGLLSVGIRRALPDARVIGVEADPARVAEAAAAGIGPMTALKVTRETLPQFRAIVREHGVNVLVARRVISELWPYDFGGGRLFAELLHEEGVAEVFLQGRARRPDASWPLATVDDEAALFLDHYSIAERHLGERDVYYLTARK